MVTQTTNYNFNTPTEGSDDDLWGGYLNANWNALDAIILSLQQQIDNQKIKVGDLYLSTDATDPATKLGYGTWVAHGAGRALIGVGDNGESTWAIDEERGSETHTLTSAQIPSHTHQVDPPLTGLSMDAVGNHQHTLAGVGGTVGGGTTLRTVADIGSTFNYNLQSTDAGHSTFASAPGGAFTPTGTVNIGAFTSGSTGSGNAHNNVQPSIAVYVWKRTA